MSTAAAHDLLDTPAGRLDLRAYWVGFGIFLRAGAFGV